MKDYRNIITLPHPTSHKHKQMPLYERAAQFAPFAALAGFDAQIGEEARWVDSRPALSEEDLLRLNAAFAILMESDRRRTVRLVRFIPDETKAGGILAPLEGEVRRVDLTARRLIFRDKSEVALDDIFSLAIL